MPGHAFGIKILPRGKGVKNGSPTENRLVHRLIVLTPIMYPVIVQGKQEFWMEGCVEHGISFQPPTNRPPFGLSRILREERIGFCREVHQKKGQTTHFIIFSSSCFVSGKGSPTKNRLFRR